MKFFQDVVLVCDDARSHSDDGGAECQLVSTFLMSVYAVCKKNSVPTESFCFLIDRKKL